MDFEFSPEQRAFAEEVEHFLDEHDDPDVFDLTRENMAQIVDTPKRRAFMRAARRAGLARPHLAEGVRRLRGRGRLRVPPQRGARRRAAARRSARASASSARRSSRTASDFLKQEFLPKILRNDVEFAVGYSEPNAGSDAASMRLKAERGERDGKPGWILNGQKTWTTSAHFAEWYWLGTRTDPDDKHRGITLMLVPLDQPGVTIKGIWTMGDERTNEVFIEDVFVPDEYVVGEVEPRLPVHLAGARPRAVHDVHVLADQAAPRPADRLRAHRDARRRAAARRPGRSGSDIARLVTDAEVARVLGLRVVAASMKGEKVPGTPPPTVESSQYKLFATEFSRRLASASMDIGGPGHAAAGARPRTRRWRAGPSRRTATP